MTKTDQSPILACSTLFYVSAGPLVSISQGPKHQIESFRYNLDRRQFYLLSQKYALSVDDTVEEIERKFPFNQASLGDRFTRLNFQPTLLVLYQKCIKMLPRKYTIQFITCIIEIIFKANILFKLKSKVFCIGPPGHENGSDNGSATLVLSLVSATIHYVCQLLKNQYWFMGK